MGILETSVARNGFNYVGALVYRSTANYSYQNYNSSGNGRIGTLSFMASLYNTIYGNSSTVTPKSLKTFMLVKY